MAVDAELEDEIGALAVLCLGQIVITGGAAIVIAAGMRLVAGAQDGGLGESPGAEFVVLAGSDAIVEAGLGIPLSKREATGLPRLGQRGQAAVPAPLPERKML